MSHKLEAVLFMLPGIIAAIIIFILNPEILMFIGAVLLATVMMFGGFAICALFVLGIFILLGWES